MGTYEEKDVMLDLKKDIFLLHNLFATHECWGIGDSFGPIQKNKVDQVKNMCRKLRMLCSRGGLETGDTNFPDAIIQDNLRNLGLVD